MTTLRVINASHLPRRVAATVEGERTVAAHGDVCVIVPALDPAAIDRVCDALLENAERLRRMPVSRIIAAIDRAARRVTDHDGPFRDDVLQSLVHVSGMSAPMAEHVLDRIAQDWLAPALEQLVRDQLGGPAIIEGFVRDGRAVRAIAPPLGLHVLSGNVPGVGVTSVVRALLVRSAVLAKTASGEPTLTPAFARALAETDAEIGECVAVTSWSGGDIAIESAALARVGLVVHYGSADSIASLRARAHPRARFIDHGPRISFAIVRADSAGSAAPASLARAIALFDQQGCVSPQIAYVIGSRDQARTFAAATADALAVLQDELPRGRIDAAEAAAIREARARAEFGAGRELRAPADLAWSVILSDDPAFEGSCLNRTIIIKHAAALDDVIANARPVGALLQTVGVDGFFGHDLENAASALAEIGVTRVTSLADMPWPPPGWHHDGRGGLTELVSFVDLEA